MTDKIKVNKEAKDKKSLTKVKGPGEDKKIIKIKLGESEESPVMELDLTSNGLMTFISKGDVKVVLPNTRSQTKVINPDGSERIKVKRAKSLYFRNRKGTTTDEEVIREIILDPLFRKDFYFHPKYVPINGDPYAPKTQQGQSDYDSAYELAKDFFLAIEEHSGS